MGPKIESLVDTVLCVKYQVAVPLAGIHSAVQKVCRGVSSAISHVGIPHGGCGDDMIEHVIKGVKPLRCQRTTTQEVLKI